ncbi:hypothetical protein [Stenomitos frigidus]|nr:hypothetical protein [Stenomitos frigidus]
MVAAIGRTIRTPENLCPHCGYKLDACSVPFSLDSPSVGDLSVCIDCAGLLQFGKGLVVQALAQDVILDLMLTDPSTYAQLMQFQAAALAAKEGDR